LFEDADSWGQALVEASKHFAQVLGGSVYNLSLEFSGEQLAVIKNLLDSANQQLPLHLIPGFFADDETGAKATQALEVFSKKVEQFHSLEGAVKTALKLESSVTKSGTDDLKGLQRIASSLGAELGTLNELRILHQQLVETSGKLSSANDNLVMFLSEKKIPYNGSTQKLEQLLSFTDLVLNAPGEYFHLQTPGLTRDGAVQALEQLLALKVSGRVLKKNSGIRSTWTPCRMKEISSRPS